MCKLICFENTRTNLIWVLRWLCKKITNCKKIRLKCLTYQSSGGWANISLVLLRCLLFIVHHQSFVITGTGTVIIIQAFWLIYLNNVFSGEYTLPDPSKMFESTSDEETLVQLWPWKLMFWGRNVVVAQYLQLFSFVSAELEPLVEWSRTEECFSDT